MKERSFIITDPDSKFLIHGGDLWKAPEAESTSQVLDEANKQLIIANLKGFGSETLLQHMRKKIRDLSVGLNIRLIFDSLGSSLINVIPATIIIFFIGIIGAYGNLVNELINLGEGTTTLYLSKWELFWVETLAFVIGVYAFPFFFEGDYGSIFKSFQDTLGSSRVLKRRLKSPIRSFKKAGFIDRVVIWNPNPLAEDSAWITESLLPALIELDLPIEFHIREDEKFIIEKLLDDATKQSLTWELTYIEEERQENPDHHIHLDYLELWERDLLPVLAASSTIMLPESWQEFVKHKYSAEDSLEGIVSVSLSKEVMRQFQERLFSDSYQEHEVSLGLFISRCINDYGILYPFRSPTDDMWEGNTEIMQLGIEKIRTELNYIPSFYLTNTQEILDKVKDPAAALVLTGVHRESSLFNHNKLLAIEGFIKITFKTEQFKVLRSYWELITSKETPEGLEDLETELYRMISPETLDMLSDAFRRAGMYSRTNLAFTYLRAIYPVTSGIGKGRILAEQGKFKEGVEHLVALEAEWMQGYLSDFAESLPEQFTDEGVVTRKTRFRLYVSLNVMIVMNRLRDYKAVAERSFAVMKRLLESFGDGEKDNYHLCRYYNVLASYYEWEEDFQAALDTYALGLQIPGVDKSLISSLLVNKGIIYRLLARTRKENEVEVAIEDLKGAVKFNGEGVEMKAILGNEDQLPIALHNLAETYIELAVKVAQEEDKQFYFRKAYDSAQDGIDINERIGSVKKEAQLLVERFIAGQFLTQLGAAEELPIQTTVDAFNTWVSSNLTLTGYNVDVVLYLLKHLEGFTATDLDGVHQWLSASIQPIHE